jgi:hypothetical protein
MWNSGDQSGEIIASVQGRTLGGCVCVWGGGGGGVTLPIFFKIGPKCRSQNAFEETKETLLFQCQLD